MSNSNGSYDTTTELMFRALDKLPLPIRERIAKSSHDYVPQPILTRYTNLLCEWG